MSGRHWFFSSARAGHRTNPKLRATATMVPETESRHGCTNSWPSSSRDCWKSCRLCENQVARISSGRSPDNPQVLKRTLCLESVPALESSPITIIFTAVLLLVAVGIGFVSIGTQQTIGHTATGTVETHFANPLVPNFFINGGLVVGSMCFDIPGSHPTSLNVTAAFPWSEYSSYPLVQHFVPIDYSFESFPLSGAVPKWLTLSMQPSHVTIQEAVNAQTNLIIEIDAPVSSGTQGSIAVDAAFVDPVSGISAVQVMAINLHVNPGLTAASPC
jgi:hypothetical protein